MSSRLTQEWFDNNSAKVVKAGWEAERPGLNNTIITIWFDKAVFPKERAITYDYRNGVMLEIKEDHGDMVKAVILSVNRDPHAYLPERYLEQGVEWLMISNVPSGEYDTFS